ncbi:MAG: ribosome small subunit-dependent GTPase [Actinomycetota bacterium]
MSSRHHHLDEDDVRSRPGRNKSRPRSKDRPSHSDRSPGFVVAVDRGRFTVVVDEGADTEREVYAIKARELGRKGVLVGDRVGLVGDISGATDTLARLVAVDPRTSLLRRSVDDADDSERAIVANAQQVLIVQALADPVPRLRFIDRCIVAALDQGIVPIVVLTKSDLASDEEIRETLNAMDIDIYTTRRDGDVSELADALEDKVSVVIGHSGVGKSTLVNKLVPNAYRLTGDVNDVTGRGRHTSTSAVALELPSGGWIIDTPGVRSFGLGHIDVEKLITFFPELEDGTERCPRACSHIEEECGLDAWIEDNNIPASRLDSLRRLTRSLQAGD